MSPNKQEEQHLPLSGIGDSLKGAREAKGYSIEYVADELHLRPSIVVAMEEENYSVLPADIFLKGYVKSYARLVHLNEANAVALLEAHLARESDLTTSNKQSADKRKRHKKMKYIVALLLIAAVVGVIFYVLNEENNKSQQASLISNSEHQVSQADSDVATPLAIESEAVSEGKSSNRVENELPAISDVAEESAASLDAAETLSEPVDINEPKPLEAEASNVSLLVNEAAQTEEVKQTTNDVAEVTDAVELTTPLPTAPGQADTSSARAITEVATEVATEQATPDTELTEASIEPISTPEATLETGSIKVSFTGECWFTLKNGLGKTVAIGLKKAGDEVNYSGELPFSVVIGAVSEVAVVFNDKTIDFSTVRVRNNRASLELTH